MLAVRDQENFVHGQQTAAAAKPLNQGLAAKTPGNKAPKTPFKVALNDENVVFRGGKSVLKANGKGNENLFTGAKKGTEVDKNTFVTPAGAKTTNAKTKAFQTPAPPSIDNTSAKTQPQSRSPRLRRAKVKVLATDDAEPAPEPEEREIEYMPPRGEPLPDLPDDYWGPEKAFPMFEGKNYAWDVDRLEREDAVREERIRKETDETLQKACDDMFAEAVANTTGTAPAPAPATALSRPTTASSNASTGAPAARKPTAPKATREPTTLASRTAASALRQPSNPSSSRAHFSAPTAAAKARLPTSFPFPARNKPLLLRLARRRQRTPQACATQPRPPHRAPRWGTRTGGLRRLLYANLSPRMALCTARGGEAQRYCAGAGGAGKGDDPAERGG
ncbi:hypothetical protein H2199_003296 [Coniosporium tulheliwenetii]|uniref:Uncharacterized protein n=1 Tax=Coniosporium tulheliwenetii TaxID=3383036 RepID=A0ACC2ZCU4_9PEZI|nr:hypothetical protein H2199_003296 [Cladosporium sp. JES 115]